MKNSEETKNGNSLRERALELMKNRAPVKGEALSEADILKIIHELEVYQIELELQNKELIQAESIARDTTDKYIELYDFAPVGFFTLSQEGEILELNLAAAQLLGKNRTSLLNRKLGFFITYDTKLAFNSFLQKAFKEGFYKSGLISLESENHEVRSIELTGKCDEDGNRCFITSNDITERIKVEAELKSSEEKHRKYIENAPVGIFVADSEGRYLDVNPAACKITGYTKEELLNSSIMDIIASQQLASDMNTFSDLKIKGELNAESLLRRKDGKDVHVDLSLVALPDDQFMAFCSDITEKKEAEKELVNKSNFINEIIDSSAVSTWISDEKGTAIRANPACLEFFGAREDEVVAKYNLFKDEVLEKKGFLPRINRVFQEGEHASLIVDYDIAEVKHFGVESAKHKVVQSKFAPIFDENGKVKNVIVQTFDLTDIKRAESSLRRSEGLLKSMEKAAKIGGWEVDLNTMEPFFTEGTSRIYELPIDEVPAVEDGMKYYAPEYQHVIQDAVMKAVKDKKPYDLELKFITAKGKTIWVRTICQIEVKDNKAVKLFGALQDITEKKQAEIDLHINEEKYGYLYKNALVAMFRVSLSEGEVVLANNAAAKLFGYPSLNQFKKTFKSTKHYVNHEDWKVILDRLNKDGYIDSILMHSKKLDGTTLWNQASFRMSHDKKFIDCISFDATERILAIEELKELNDIFYEFVYHSPVYCFIKELDGNSIKVKMASENYLEMVGKSGSEIIGMTNEQIFPPEFASEITSEDRDVTKGGKQLIMDKEFNNRNYTSYKFPIYTGSKSFLAGFTIDITDRIESEKKAIRERKKTQQYLDVADVMLVSLDVEGIVRLINPKGCKVLGYEKDEIIGKNWFDNFLPESMRKDVKKVAEKVFSGESESVRYHENYILTKSGEEKLIAWHNVTFKDSKGKIAGTLSSGEDITMRKLAEKELKDHRDKLEELVAERTKELELNIKELDRMLKVFVGREVKIRELSEQIRELKAGQN